MNPEAGRSAGPELTIRGLFLGAAMTLVFTAANVYLGLKVGLTFASSIPAAVISMAVLSVFRDSNIRENNIVQTCTSAAGALASIIFVLPGLVIVGWWTGFPFWTSFFVCASGGILGVLFTIPLRRALVTTSDLPYPEGVAGAEVLKAGAAAHEHGKKSTESREGLFAIIAGSIVSAGLVILSATRIAAGEAAHFFRLGAAGATGYQFTYSLALIAAGHLVGLSVGMAMLLGLTIAWLGAVPILTAALPPEGALADNVMRMWSTEVRFLGAGAIGIAAIWTLVRLTHRIAMGLSRTLSNWRMPQTDAGETDRDLSGSLIAALGIISLAVVAILAWQFTRGNVLAPETLTLVLMAVPFALFGGFAVAVVCGYMAGLIGSSNSPISGVGILAVVSCALILLVIAPPSGESAQALTAFALFVTAIVFAGATSSNDNLQDLKTGQLVGATPWRQQVALMVGVVTASLVVPPVLNLLAQAYGFAGAPNVNTVTATPLPAPQANLISALAAGVISRDVNWAMIGTGAAIGAAVIAFDAFLGWRKWLRVPPLAVGIAIYLPMAVTLPVIIGSLIGWRYNAYAERHKNPERSKRLGVLIASGMIVGESLFGVLNAGLIVGLNRDAPIALVGADFAPAFVLGPAAFLLMLAMVYGWALRRGRA